MSQIIVRGLDDQIKEALKARATRHKVSMEEEVRTILKHSLLPESELPLGTGMHRRFASQGLDEALPEIKWKSFEPPKFD